ncbi:MAG: response regulator transcription factor [Lewinellaceae bacterium]|nr:response regulator transcription factor [Lewinellaceae bacterium]
MQIVVADDQPIFIEGLLSVLSQPGNPLQCNIRGIARNGQQMLQLLREQAVDLVLLDLNLLEQDSLKLLPELKRVHPHIRILVMTVYDDPRLVKAAFKAGADGYILKSGSKEELFRAIAEVIEGNTFLGRGVAVTDRHNNGAGGASMPEDRFVRKYGLTKREMEIMQYIGQAFSNKDIAERLFISDQTVSVHRKNIMRKIGVKSTANLIKIAYENNLV